MDSRPNVPTSVKDPRVNSVPANRNEAVYESSSSSMRRSYLDSANLEENTIPLPFADNLQESINLGGQDNEGLPDVAENHSDENRISDLNVDTLPDNIEVLRTAEAVDLRESYGPLPPSRGENMTFLNPEHQGREFNENNEARNENRGPALLVGTLSGELLLSDQGTDGASGTAATDSFADRPALTGTDEHVRETQCKASFKGKKDSSAIAKRTKKKHRVENVRPKRKPKVKAETVVEADGQEVLEEPEENIQVTLIVKEEPGLNKKRSGERMKSSSRKMSGKTRETAPKKKTAKSSPATPIARPAPKKKVAVSKKKTNIPKVDKDTSNARTNSKTRAVESQATNSEENDPSSETPSRASSGKTNSRTRTRDTQTQSKTSPNAAGLKISTKDTENPVVKIEKRSGSRSQNAPSRLNETQKEHNAGGGLYSSESKGFSVTQVTTSETKHSYGNERQSSGGKTNKRSDSPKGKTLHVEPPNSSSSSEDESTPKNTNRSKSKRRKRIHQRNKISPRATKRTKLEDKGIMSKIYMKPRKRTVETEMKPKVVVATKPDAATAAKSEPDAKPRNATPPKDKKARMEDNETKYSLPVKKPLAVKGTRGRPSKTVDIQKGKKHGYAYKEFARRRRVGAASRAKSTRKRKANAKSRKRKKGAPKKTSKRRRSRGRKKTAKSRKN